MYEDSSQTDHLLTALEAGNAAAAEQLFARYRPQLRAFIQARLDPALANRLDASDVVQETQVVLCARLQDYFARRPMPFHTWALKTAFDCLAKARRTHLLADKRSVLREESLLSARSSQTLARFLVSSAPSAPAKAMREEHLARIRQELLELKDADREILVMRYLDGLTVRQIADILDLSPDAVSARHGRALRRLHQRLTTWYTEDEPT